MTDDDYKVIPYTYILKYVQFLVTLSINKSISVKKIQVSLKNA
jgi:hypothetical protein